MAADPVPAPDIQLRPITPADLDFLRGVYRSSREAELEIVPWTPEQKDAFIEHQFSAQHAWYQEHYTGAAFDVVMVDGQPAGRLYVHRGPREIRLVDIALLAEFRNRGIGTALMRDLMAECAASGRSLTIHVELFNPARGLYERLGFAALEEKGPYVLMEWRP